MVRYQIGTALTPLSAESSVSAPFVVLLNSQELEHSARLGTQIPLLCHTPSPKTAQLCKAECHSSHICGTITTPRRTRGQAAIAFGYLLTADYAVLCDDSGAAHTMLQRLCREKLLAGPGIGGFFYGFLELLLAKDMHHLQALEDELDAMEDEISGARLEEFSPRMSALRKEISGWSRYYTQLDGLVCEFLENENAYFDSDELRLFHLVEKRVNRLLAQAQSLHEYAVQLRELFQSEIDMRQNHIMKILTIVTTIFLPLSLVAGWYGMNFAYMPELHWQYGYLAVIIASAAVVLISLYIMKKKHFW